jgi:hypothetical protein
MVFIVWSWGEGCSAAHVDRWKMISEKNMINMRMMENLSGDGRVLGLEWLPWADPYFIV